MSVNTLLTPQWITNEAMALLVNELSITKKVNRQYDDSFKAGGAKLGMSINIRKPAWFIGGNGQAVVPEGVLETYVPLTLSYQRNIATEVSSQDLALSINDYSRLVLKPQVERLATLIDSDVAASALGVNNFVGAPGTTPSAIDTYWGAKTRLDNLAAPRGDRHVVLNPLAEQKIGNALVTQFNPQRSISEIYDEGEMGYALGADWSMDQNVYVHTTGTPGASTPLTNGVPASGATSVVTDGWSSTTLKAGDIISFAGIFRTNPANLASTGELAQFVVTATVSDSSGDLTIPISPPIIGPGSPLQNVTAIPADGVAILVWGAGTGAFTGVTAKVSPQNLFFHRDAITLACVDLPLPGGTDMAERATSRENGLSFSVIRDYNVLTGQWIQRMDILYGVAVLRQELACRVVG
jgi:hypothetical protein